jgi:hypothetical protein
MISGSVEGITYRFGIERSESLYFNRSFKITRMYLGGLQSTSDPYSHSKSLRVRPREGPKPPICERSFNHNKILPNKTQSQSYEQQLSIFVKLKSFLQVRQRGRPNSSFINRFF